MLTSLFDLISAVYALAALYTLGELWSRRRQLRDGVFTPAERRLAEMVGFLLLTPLGVLAHEAAHWAVARALGADDAAISFRLYWGYVSYSRRLAPEEDWLVSAAGPLASVLLGFAAALAALRAGGFVSAALASFGQATLMLALVAYPIMSFLGLFGDFVAIYLFGGWARALAAAAVHALALVAALRLLRRFEWWGAPAPSDPAPRADRAPAAAGAPPSGPPAAVGRSPGAGVPSAAGTAPPATADQAGGAAPPAPRPAALGRAWVTWAVASALGLIAGKLLAPTAFLFGSVLLAVAASAVGAAVPQDVLRNPAGLAAYGAAVGASVGWAQYVVLQRRFGGVERWIGHSLLGGAAGGAAASLVGVVPDPLVGLGLCAGQALVFQRSRRAALWASIGAATLGGLSLATAAVGGEPTPLVIVDGVGIARSLAAGIAYGAATGALLFWRPRQRG